LQPNNNVTQIVNQCIDQKKFEDLIRNLCFQCIQLAIHLLNLEEKSCKNLINSLAIFFQAMTLYINGHCKRNQNPIVKDYEQVKAMLMAQ
jgi:hypothetical protein